MSLFGLPAITHKETDRNRLFTRRALLLAGGQGLLFSALVAKLYSLQVFQHERYDHLAERNRIRIRLIPPERGAILDRHGHVLARDEPSHRVCVIRQDTPSLAQLLRDYCAYMNLPEDIYQDFYRRIQSYPRHLPYVLNDHLSWEQVVHFETHAETLEGLYVDQGRTRVYPYGAACAHVLGYVGDNVTTGTLAQGKAGQVGVEKILNASLAGMPGQVQIEVDARHKKIRTLQEHPAQEGCSEHLTLSAPLQAYVYERLKETLSGVAVVIDIQTGDLLACVSVPGYDPHQIMPPCQKETWETLIKNPLQPLLNKAVQGQYAPGSLFKPLVVLAALEAGVVTPETSFFCSGRLELNQHTFHCHHKTGHGAVSMRQALRFSCDVYFYELARQVGIQRMGKMAHLFGLGQKTALHFPGEQKGLIPNQDWKWRIRKERWRLAETLMAGIGQGYLLATPLQMTVMLARLANGRFAVHPRLFLGSTPPPFEPLNLSQAWVQLVQEAMVQTCNMPGSTAYHQRISEPGYEMAGKTATVQVKRISVQDRQRGLTSEASHAWHEREHAMFMAYAPVHQPRYGIYVLCEHGGRGSQAAAPIARDILWQAQKMNIVNL